MPAEETVDLPHFRGTASASTRLTTEEPCTPIRGDAPSTCFASDVHRLPFLSGFPLSVRRTEIDQGATWHAATPMCERARCL